jgi:DNA replication protein DnaC
MEPCTVCNKVRLARMVRLGELSSLRGRALGQHFEGFVLEGAASPAAPAYNAAVAFAQEPAGWLVIHGPKGNGKSHLAAATAHYLVKVRRIPTLFLTVPDLFQGFYREIDASRHGQALDDVPLLETAWKADVLILDDLGAEQSTPYTEQQLFLILDHRYREKLATMVITNNALESLPGRIRSRLCERGFSQVVCNPAPDYRLGDGSVTL